MKIAVCGKGGVGKTFIAGSLAETYAGCGNAVIAIDADSSPNLALTLQVLPAEAERIVPIAENAELIRLKTGTDYPGVFRLTYTVDDIISKYGVKTPAGPSLLVMGTVRSMGSGCTCPAHSLVRALMRHLVVERDEFVILDMEAGLEHLGRGTADGVDIMLVVTDANKKSRETASAIIRLARESSVRDIRIVGNRVSGLREEELIGRCAADNSVPLAAAIPYDNMVAEAGITGEPVDHRNSPSIRIIRQLAEGLVYGNTNKNGSEIA